MYPIYSIANLVVHQTDFDSNEMYLFLGNIYCLFTIDSQYTILTYTK
jgi:hypothetical protein